MHVSQIEYERLINTGNYSHEKYNLVIDLNEEDEPQEAINLAKKYVNANVVKRQQELLGPEDEEEWEA